jgi:hypothetical protein
MTTDAAPLRRRLRRRARATPVPVRLGPLAEDGLAPALFAIVDRGVRRRPALAETIRDVEVELNFEDGHPPVRIVFGDRHVLVQDGPARQPDLRITGTLSNLNKLMVAPLLGGLPSPISAHGRAALGMVAFGRVRISGRLSLVRRLLALIRI